MQFLKTASWVILAVAIALFSKANWDIQPSYSGRVPIKLWDDWILLIRLPILIVSAFLLGLLPMWIFARVSRWSIRRRLQTAEQALAASTTPPTPVIPAETIPSATTPNPSTSGPSPSSSGDVAETKL